MERTAKTSFTITPSSKHKLENMRSDLRLEGFLGVTEGAIVEALLADAKIESVRKHFKKRPKS